VHDSTVEQYGHELKDRGLPLKIWTFYIYAVSLITGPIRLI